LKKVAPVTVLDRDLNPIDRRVLGFYLDRRIPNAGDITIQPPDNDARHGLLELLEMLGKGRAPRD
jgi:hypothetical protein